MGEWIKELRKGDPVFIQRWGSRLKLSKVDRIEDNKVKVLIEGEPDRCEWFHLDGEPVRWCADSSVLVQFNESRMEKYRRSVAIVGISSVFRSKEFYGKLSTEVLEEIANLIKEDLNQKGER